MTVIATEVLRTHPTRPGLLAANYNYRTNPTSNQAKASIPSIHTYDTFESFLFSDGIICLANHKDTALQLKLADIIAATEDFQMVFTVDIDCP